MYTISNEILNSQIEVQELDLETIEKIKRLIWEKYLDENKKSIWIWERLKEYESLADNNGWAYIKEFVSDNSCIMFFNQDDGRKMFAISNGSDLHSILSETTGFEFYITDSDGSYLICFNHHDILFGCGNAIGWIQSLKNGR